MVQLVELTLRNRKTVNSIDIAPDGKTLLIGQDATKRSHNLTFWGVPSFKENIRLRRNINKNIISARFANFSNQVLLLTSESKLYFLDLNSGSSNFLDVGDASVMWFRFAREAQRIAISGSRTQVWDLARKKAVWELQKPSSSAGEELKPIVASLNKDGSRVAVAGVNTGEISIFDVASGNLVKVLTNGPKHARWIEIDPTERFVAAIEWYSHGAFVWEIGSGKKVLEEELGPPAEAFWSLRFNPDGTDVAIGMISGYLLLLSIADGKVKLEEQVQRGRIWDLCFTPDAQFLVSGGDKGNVRVIDLQS